MKWTSLLADPKGIEGVYGGDVPDLRGVSLHDIELSREGPALNLRFDMPSFPRRPPTKWTTQGFNTVQVTLSLTGLGTISFNGFTSNPLADISLHPQDGITLEISSTAVQLRATADMAYIRRLSAYALAAD
ncbi:Imm50 family immunity protein [Streptomyces sp. NPDC058955]|uniref:Imm50 family immunity protein n=1 Tax=unclassified Streptomyces TaxID=2593676 RepID=UPI00364A1563